MQRACVYCTAPWAGAETPSGGNPKVMVMIRAAVEHFQVQKGAVICIRNMR